MSTQDTLTINQCHGPEIREEAGGMEEKSPLREDGGPKKDMAVCIDDAEAAAVVSATPGWSPQVANPPLVLGNARV